MSKNYNTNDQESCMEGIYGCMERIEAGINELKKVQSSTSNSIVDNEAYARVVQDIKALINKNNKQGFEYTETKIKKFAGAVVDHLSILNDNFKDTKSAIVNTRTSTEVLKSLNEIKTNQEANIR
ncbi:hypothetical protein NXW48_03795 [Phocaeicola vulgatus]|nr:hypothetical protein [Phocaeicola vulgatus]